jgi:hypothetical protein
MAIWTAEIKELEKFNEPISGCLPALEEEMGQLLETGDENVTMLYSGRCLEIIVTDLCETELQPGDILNSCTGIYGSMRFVRK